MLRFTPMPGGGQGGRCVAFIARSSLRPPRAHSLTVRNPFENEREREREKNQTKPVPTTTRRRCSARTMAFLY